MEILPRGHDAKWIEIPHFQRGISWELENVQELLSSSSILLGNVILSTEQVVRERYPFLLSDQASVHILIDGLQRLAVGTALLAAIHDLVLTATPTRPSDAPAFRPLKSSVDGKAPYYLHNDREFLNHPRLAIRDQYSQLKKQISEYCVSTLGKGSELAESIERLFLLRQVAIDVYHDFRRQEVLSTFIGINTVRVDLGPVDLLRALVIEQATGSGWDSDSLEQIENEFTHTLTENQKPISGYIPFINASLKILAKGKGDRLFPSWSTGLSKEDVQNLLSFIDKFEGARNAYLDEIKASGNLPVSLVLAHYYLAFLAGGHKADPSFFDGKTAENSELHTFLICCYRLLLDGTIGRTTNFLEAILEGSRPLDLKALSDEISNTWINGPISAQVDDIWLEQCLNSSEKKKAPRIFNAMLLPPKSSLGADFKPLHFGRSAKSFHVDHLLPESLIDKLKDGAKEGQTLRNLAPLPQNLNALAKAAPCSFKLGPSGIYESYCMSTTHQVHDYCKWLIETYSSLGSPEFLDDQANLEKNSPNDVGTDRIRQIARILIDRI